MKKRMTILSLIVLSTLSYADIFGTGANQFSIDFVNIGYADNVADSTGYGAIDYNYRMGKYEVTIDQFSKAVASDSRISNGYFTETYWNDSPRDAGVNAPASWVNWLESAMFCNWLSSGNALTGVYQFDVSGGLSSIDRSYRNDFGLAYVIPTEDEWYKAAYYRPVNNGSYSDYANGLDTAPVVGTSEGWNYDNLVFDNIQNEVWEAGFGAEEQNGTHDMNGNILEWTESLYVSSDPSHVVLRGGGGGGGDNTYGLRASVRSDFSTLDYESSDYGFRVASIPEPSSVLLLTIGSGGLLFYRRAKRRHHNDHFSRRNFQ